MLSFFDSTGEVVKLKGRLPHWIQNHSTYFITFSTADSLPRHVVQRIEKERSHWLAKHGINSTKPNWREHLKTLPPYLQLEYQRQSFCAVDRYLDKCHGSCHLSQLSIASLVAKTIFHHNHDRYWITDLVVMPNHIHALAFFQGEHDLKKQLYCWKNYSARRINQQLGVRGRFWQSESFDHLVRSARAFWRFRKYIADNPTAAHLQNNEFLYYSDPSLVEESPF